MASASWLESLPQVGLSDTIIRSTAFRQAVSSDYSVCCVARLRWPQFAGSGGLAIDPDRVFPSYLKCPAHQFCESRRISLPAGLIEGQFRRPRLARFPIPRLVPLINPCDKRTFAHRYLEDGFPMVAVQLWKLMRSGPAFRLALSKGLNRM